VHFVIAKLRFNTSSQTNAVKPVVEDFVFLQNSASTICYLYSRGTAIEYAIAFQHWKTGCANEHACQCIPKNVIVLQNTLSIVEHAHSAFSPVVNFVPPENWVTLGLDPDPCHRVVENLVFF